VNGEGALERRYRRLLAWYPAEHRRTYAEEMIGVLLASAPAGRERPSPAEALDLIGGGLRARLRRLGTWFADPSWPDALAVGSVALPVIVLAALAVNYLQGVVAAGFVALTGYGDFYLPALAVALPPLLALRYRRAAALVALVAAVWFMLPLVRYTGVGGYFDPLEAGYCATLLVQAIALAVSPGPRRAADIMTRGTWLVLCSAGVALGFASIYHSWALPTWLSALLVIAFLSAVATWLAATLPRQVPSRLLLVLAIPAGPAAVWTVGYLTGRYVAFLSYSLPYLAPDLLLACLIAAMAWRVRRREASTP
jgi:hypothetical protein